MGRLLVNRRLRERPTHVKANTKKDEMEKPSPILSSGVNQQDSKTGVKSISQQVSAVKPPCSTKNATTITLLHQNHSRNFNDISETFVSSFGKSKTLKRKGDCEMNTQKNEKNQSLAS